MFFARSGILLLFFLMIVLPRLYAQSADTVPGAQTDTTTIVVQTVDTIQQPSIAIPVDTISRPVWEPGFPDSIAIRFPDFVDHVWQNLIIHHPYFGFGETPQTLFAPRRKTEGKEALFYSVLGLLLIFAFLRNSFAKYMSDLYILFFRSSLKQRQIRDQLLQSPLPSLLFNLFYLVSAGYYIALLLQHFQMRSQNTLPELFGMAALFLTIIYTIKFITLKSTGWLFNVKNAMDSYIFIVFAVNKLIGIWLLPFVVALSFTAGFFYELCLYASLVGVAALFIYRFFLTYFAVHKQVKLNPFHFLLYLLAFEIIPLLLIYKLLFLFF